MRLRRALFACGALAALAAAFGVGVVTSGRLALLPGKLRSAIARVHETAKPWASAAAGAQHGIQTTLLRLSVQGIDLPASRSGTGGSMTRLSHEVLLLDHTGTLFAVRGTTARKAHIAVPDNGFDAYVVAARNPKYAAFPHSYDTFRYNDILYYEDGAAAGLVVSYTEWRAAQDCYGTAVAHLALPEGVRSIDALEKNRGTWRIVFRTRPCLPLKDSSNAIEGHIAGGRMVYRGGGKVLLGSGDYQWDGVYGPVAYAQRPDSDYGKIIELDLPHATSRIVATGTRNVQGIMIDRTGRVLAVEHGPRGGDELNLIEEGGNYGWPEVTLGTRYNGLPWPTSGPYGRHDGFRPPVYAWLPSVGTSGITQVRGFDPAWDGDFLVASLTGRTLFHIRMEGDRVLFAEPVPIGERIRNVLQDADGRIVMWTDARRLLFLSRDTTPTGAFVTNAIARMALEPARAARVTAAVERCAECHTLETTSGGTRAPSLGLVFGRPVASTDFAYYSPALRAHGGTWDEQTLTQYLSDPAGYVRGTTMPSPGLDPQSAADVVHVLQELRQSRE